MCKQNQAAMVALARTDMLEKCYALYAIVPLEDQSIVTDLVLDIFTEAEIEYWFAHYVTVH